MGRVLLFPAEYKDNREDQGKMLFSRECGVGDFSICSLALNVGELKGGVIPGIWAPFENVQMLARSVELNGYRRRWVMVLCVRFRFEEL